MKLEEALPLISEGRCMQYFDTEHNTWKDFPWTYFWSKNGYDFSRIHKKPNLILEDLLNTDFRIAKVKKYYVLYSFIAHNINENKDYLRFDVSNLKYKSEEDWRSRQYSLEYMCDAVNFIQLILESEEEFDE